MRIGVIFPQTTLGADRGAVRAYAQATEELGYTHLRAADHVLGADRAAHPGWTRAYDVDSTFHEPFVLFGHLAAITSLELATAVIILPQRQTALVAKQAAEVDLLTGGRFRLGIGVGWNHVEFEALGQDFDNRGRRYDEQITLLRRYWTERSITHHGEFETVTGAGIAPHPVQRPIPLWFGAGSAPAYRRIGRLGDGWFPQLAPGSAELEAAQRVISRGGGGGGRAPPPPRGGAGGPGARAAPPQAAKAPAWRDSGATHLAVNTTQPGITTVDQHIDALTRAAAALDLKPA
ncbi:LLM class F420-dependent oxidoreductase [Actinoplanes flavus]|uniref:LLM class F420-dependent oxidoreductase n=1 Tax=Actinoplanes flavus TaxID=2820290 RepID=UPI0035577B99